MRQEAISWCLEDRPSDTKAVKSRSILCGSVGDGGWNTDSVQDKSSATLDDILKVVSEKGKAIGELVSVMRDGVAFRERSYKGGKPKPRFQFTEDGSPVCFKCNGVGHIARECRPHQQGQPAARDAHSQGN